MQQILQNLANIHMIEFCKKNNIDCSDTHIIKYGRGFRWALEKRETKNVIAIVQFHKYAVPTFQCFNVKLTVHTA